MRPEPHVVTDASKYWNETGTGRCARAWAGLARTVAQLRSDMRGVAAVEFGLIAPVMMVMLLGTVEITRAVSMDRRVSLVTSMIADLVAREEKLTANDVNAIYDIAAEVMNPYDAGPLKISIVPVMSSPTNASSTLVYPSTTNRPSYHGASQPAKCEAYPLTPGLLGKNESLIAVEASYTFKPLFGSYMMSSVVWHDTAIAKPRKALCVVFDGTTCTTTCFP
jgi:Flp pilus assembly protein TadG